MSASANTENDERPDPIDPARETEDESVAGFGAGADIPNLVVYDFDGTLTTTDTFALFLRRYHGLGGWLWRIAALMPVFIAYKFGRIDRHAVKRAVIARFFTGESADALDEAAKTFAETVIPGLVRPEGLNAFQRDLKERPESLYICSASIRPYLVAWASAQGLSPDHVLSVELERDAGRITGAIHGYNVWGENKVRRISDTFPGGYSISRAYGDTEGDRAMLAAAKEPFWRPFRG